MNNKGNYKKGTRREIIKMIHMGGILPSKSLNALENRRTYREKIKQMIDEGVLNESRVKNGRHTYRIIGLNEYEKNREKYKMYLPDGYYENYVTYGQQAARQCRNKPGSVSQRIIGAAETHVIVKEAKIACEPDTKINLYQKAFLDDGGSYYYNSREIKNYTGYKDKVRILKNENKDTEKLVISSRMTGLIVSPGGIYSVYNMGQSINDWQAGGELKIKTHLDYLLGNRMENPQSCDNALTIIEEYDSLAHVLAPKTKKENKAEKSFENLNQAYKRIYSIPYSLEGKRMIEIMKIPGWEHYIREAMLANYEHRDEKVGYLPCDAITDKEEYVFLYCVPDVAGLKRFLKYAEASGEKERFIVIGFDFQTKMLVKSCNGRCRILKTNFNKFYDNFMEDHKDGN